MSQQRGIKRPLLVPNVAASSAAHGDSTPHKRRRQTNQALEALGQLVKDPSIDELDNKLNKNDILSLTLSRLLREKYWPSNFSYYDVQLGAGINSSTYTDNLNSFIIVLNSHGRIILMSDNIECYLRKNVRSLYPQLTSIYDCISHDDHESVHHMLSSTLINVEQRVICTWNLPRGKRPSRTHTESKPMLMTGHYFVLRSDENKEQEEPLFIARCEQILSSTPNMPTNSNGSTSSTTLRFVLNDQLQISEISTNTESLLGYRADELIDQPINRFIVSEHLHILEQARQNSIVGQHYTTMNVLDFYTRDGHRLTFLCNTHMLIEGRRKAMKIGFIAQLIDPSIHYDCIIYANKQNLDRLKNTIQQESSYSSTTDSISSNTQNILRSPTNEQCLNFQEAPSVSPVSALPQRRKRRRTQYMNVKREPLNFFNTVQETPQINNDIHEYQNSSPDSLTSSGSPIQELGWGNDLFSYMNDPFSYEKIKCIEDFPSIDDVNNVFGLNNNQELGLFTPTMPTMNFFA